MRAAPLPSRRRLVACCGAAAALAVAALTFLRPAFVDRLDNATYDILLRLSGTAAPSGEIVIIDIDERSLAAIGQWPWPRSTVARLIARVREAGASVVALDMVFAEHDRFEQIDPDRAGRSAEGRHDQALAGVLGERVVLGFAMTFEPRADYAPACVLHPVGLAMIQPPGGTTHAPFFQATGAVCNLPELGRAAARSGFLNAAPDADGILRRVPLVMELNGQVYPSLALASVAARTATRDFGLSVGNVNSASLMLDDRSVPVDGRSNLLLRYRGKKRTFPYVSAADVLHDRGVDSTLRDKIVFVGTTALGTREVVATPLDTLFVGVEVQATVADNLLQQDFIRRFGASGAFDGGLVLAIGAALAFLLSRTGPLAGSLATAGLLAAVWLAAAAMLSAGSFVSPLAPTMGGVAVLGVMTLARAMVERGRADGAARTSAAARSLMVQTLLSLTEVRDAETGRHSRRTQQYARILARQLSVDPRFAASLPAERVELLAMLAPLHDIGKVGIPDRILNKPGALTADELEEMRKHPTLGLEVILKAEARVQIRDDATLQLAKEIVFTHHERWDGRGYPRGLSGPEIPVAGRLMAVVDVYDAVRSRSLYEERKSHQDTVDLIVAGRATHFDPAVVEAFLHVADLFRLISEESADEQGNQELGNRVIG